MIDAEFGWTVPLHWTLWPHVYGTAQEDAVILRLFYLFPPFFLLLAVAGAIETYKAERVLYVLICGMR
jgi:hypothetical protein